MDDLIWYENGVLITQQEMLQRKFGRRVSEQEALDYTRKQKFINDFLKYCERKRKTECEYSQ